MTLAHAGHWYHSILYLVPVLLIAAALWWSGRGGRPEAPDSADDWSEEDDRALALPGDDVVGEDGVAADGSGDEAGGGGAFR